MPIYTRTGDKGTTSLYGGERIAKSDYRIEACGTVDELTSFIGLTAVKITDKKDKEFLIEIQRDLYRIMSNLSGMKIDLKYLIKRIKDFENRIDEIDRKLPKLNRFILPGGTEGSSWFQILRVICRRAERNIVRFYNNETMKQWDNVIVYFNRLSDLFFTMARRYGQKSEIVL